MCSPQLVRQFYEGHRQAGFVAVLMCLDPLTPMIAATSTEVSAHQALPPTWLFSVDKPIFIIFHGVVPGIHYGW